MLSAILVGASVYYNSLRQMLNKDRIVLLHTTQCLGDIDKYQYPLRKADGSYVVSLNDTSRVWYRFAKYTDTLPSLL